MIALILISLTRIGWTTERPSVEEFVARVFLISSRGIGIQELEDGKVTSVSLSEARRIIAG